MRQIWILLLAAACGGPAQALAPSPPPRPTQEAFNQLAAFRPPTRCGRS